MEIFKMGVNALIIYTALVVRAATSKTPINVLSASEFSFEVSTKGWTEHSTHAIPYYINNEFSEFKKVDTILCERREHSLLFNVKESVGLDKFFK